MGETARLRVRDRWLVALAGLGFGAACLAANAARRTPGVHYSDVVAPPPSSSPSSARPVANELDPSRASHWHPHLGVPDWLVRGGLTLLLGLAALLAILLIVRLVPMLERRRPRRHDEEPAVYAPAMSPEQVARQVSHALDDTLAAFRRGDRERAIIACWIRLEQIAEEAGFGRLGSDTSTELAERWLYRLPVSRQPLLELAELYREARYSSHQLPESALVTARSALERLRREISSSASAVRNPP
ncbi:MAG TPA: DUF4129 domain-containing protein [Jatrophihabitans sp.]|nr:DUF4129 domain-containing protein [Jatrophihabitans sp.]